MDFKSILEILRFVNKSDLTEVDIVQPDFKLKIKRSGGEAAHVEYVPQPSLAPVQYAPVPVAAPVVAAAPAAPVAAAPLTVAAALAPAAAAESTSGKLVRSPMVGTFYRTAAPDKPAFVQVGDVVQVGQTLCIIEAMKLFNEIESDVAGKVVKILVENAKPVEFDQPLFEIEPA
jgi:acetyl-CoA carboxylase biotin carboxyl carrier protein